MMMAKVLGTVVPSRIAKGVADHGRWLLIERSDQSGKGKGEFHIALDLVNAGPNELVLICQGSAARQTPKTQDQPVDALIVGIIDMIDEKERVVYQK